MTVCLTARRESPAASAADKTIRAHAVDGSESLETSAHPAKSH